MKRQIFTLSVLLIFLLTGYSITAQTESWPVKAVSVSGSFIDIVALDEFGNSSPIIAVIKEGDLHFMDVKAEVGRDLLNVKMLITDELYPPVKAISTAGKIFDIKAQMPDGSLLDVKGVTREGNTLRIAAIEGDDTYLAVRAVASDGRTRDVRGIKFKAENEEMKIGSVKVLAHIKAIPITKNISSHPIWSVKAINTAGANMDVVALGQKDQVFEVKAMAKNGHFHLMDIKAIKGRHKLDVKMIKEGDGLSIVALDDPGRKFTLNAKSSSGEYIPLQGIRKEGNIISVKAIANGVEYAIKAISPDGDIYDIKGVKAKSDDFEGSYVGFVHTVPFFAHIKALPPIE